MNQKSLSFKKARITLQVQSNLITFDGNFDSGNLADVRLNENQEISIVCGRDKDNKPSTKNWFHFSVQGAKENINLRLVFDKINILFPVAKITDLYRPVVKIEGGEWQRLSEPVQFEIVENDVRMRMSLHLQPGKKIFVALIYPWSFSDNENFINSLVSSCSKNQNIYINKQVLIYSVQKRPIHMIAISSNDVRNNQTEQYLDHLFPEKENQSHYKRTDKQIILITARVHPGEVGSSHAMNGMLKLLTSNEDIAIKLRKEFYFLIIPILNPDGVENGNNRMDSLGQNLNRFYHLPDLALQPSCFAVKTLVQHWRQQIFAFFDLHGHANRKSCFLYGNSIHLTRLQAQSMLFAKALSLNCEEIDFSCCNFSKKQMSSKDKNQQLSKEGCARVVVHRWTNSPYCYTLETGLHKNIKVDEKGIERYGQEFYNTNTYESIGRKMLQTFLQILQKNKKNEQLRKEMLAYANKIDKFTKKKSQKPPQQPIVTVKQIKFEQPPESKENTKKLGGSTKVLIEKRSSEKYAQIQQIMHKNKTYLLSLDNNMSDD